VTDSLKVLFAGTPEIALLSLDALLTAQGDTFTVVGVLTNPDRPAGRRRRMVSPPVKERADAAGLPVLQPEKLDGDARDAVAALEPDILVSVAYGKIFGPRFMALFPRGGINLHPSLLPRHRGPSPLQAAILAGDTETGVSIQSIAPEMDTGAVLLQEKVPLPGDITVSALHDDLGRRGAVLLVEGLNRIARGTAVFREQDHAAATYCRKITKDDGRIDWKNSSTELDRMVRAFTPWPGARCDWGGTTLQLTAAAAVPGGGDNGGGAVPSEGAGQPGRVVGVDNRRGILVQTGDGLLAVSRLKPETRKEIDYVSFLNGNQGFIGTVLK
jgi:methionyl-tRNA formyltransferase